MHNHSDALTTALTNVVRLLVLKEDEVHIIPVMDQPTPTYWIRVAASDLGKVLGKGGKTANALRLLVNAYGMKTGQRVDIDIDRN